MILAPPSSKDRHEHPTPGGNALETHVMTARLTRLRAAAGVRAATPCGRALIADVAAGCRPALLGTVLACGAAAARAQEAAVPPCDPTATIIIPERAVFGQVRIDIGDVFDPSDPEERKRLFEFANKLHVNTRPEVISRRVLFETGDPYSVRIVEESERLLRATGYIYDPHICVLGAHDGIVDVAVVTRDVWTLKPSISFGRSGGENEYSFGAEEDNLLGTGNAVSVEYSHDLDRDSLTFGFHNENLLGRWMTLDTSYSDNSDGHVLDLGLAQPFYALDTHRAAGIRFIDDDRIDPLYDAGEIVDEFRHEMSYQRLYWGRSPGLENGWARRWTVGLTRDFERFSPSPEPGATTLLPEDRELQYPFFGFELLRDHFITAKNNNQIGRTEDFYLGPRFYGELGLLSESLGSDRDGLAFSTLWSYGHEHSAFTKWLGSAQFSGRAERDEGFENAIATGSFRFYHRQSKRRLLYASLQADVAQDLDLDNQLLLGGDNGLRGYPNRFVSGDKRVLFTIEQRLFTPWYPFRLFHVGAAAFFDVGRAWGENPFSDENPGWLKDVGIGARFGSSRSSGGTVIHVDLAFPLDGGNDIDSVQLVIDTRHGF
jgi:hypothetical protein